MTTSMDAIVLVQETPTNPAPKRTYEPDMMTRLEQSGFFCDIQAHSDICNPTAQPTAHETGWLDQYARAA